MQHFKIRITSTVLTGHTHTQHGAKAYFATDESICSKNITT